MKALETEIPARSIRKLNKRFSHDIRAERVLAAAAIWRPEHLAHEFLLPQHFADPFLGWVLETTLGARGEGLDPVAEWAKFISRKSSWFWLDDEMDAVSHLWSLYDDHFDVTAIEVVEAAKLVRDLAVSRRG